MSLSPEIKIPTILDKSNLPPAFKGLRYCTVGKHYTPYQICPVHNVRTVPTTMFESPV